MGNLTKNKLDKYRKGDAFIISIFAYAKLKNNFIRESKLNLKFLYKKEDVDKHAKDGKRTRTVIVIWNNKFSDYILAIPETTIKPGTNIETINKNGTKVNIFVKNILSHPYALKINKKKARIYNSKNPYKYYNRKEIDNHIAWWKINKKNSFDYYNINYYLTLKMEAKYNEKMSLLDINYKNKK